jgi:hypothetical protein
MPRSSRLLSFAVASLAAAAFTVTAYAQQVQGTLSGTVSDPSGAVIPGASITITSLGTGLTRTQQSGAKGDFTFHDLPSGNYRVEVTQAGFNAQNYPSILVQGDRTVTLAVQLAAGTRNQTVTVNATPLLNQADNTNGYVLDHTTIQNTPLATGSFTQLAVLAPGVSAELINGTGTNEGLGNQAIWANGQRATDNTFLVDGVDVSNLFNGNSTSQVASGRATPNTGETFTSGGQIQTDTSVYDAIGNSIPTPSPEQIDEIRVNTSMYDAQQGAKSGAHIDVDTLSGSNKFHGQAYVYRGTNAFNAAPFFYKQQSVQYGGSIPLNQVNPYLHRVTAGGVFGGPIIKDKLFGFLAYNGVRITDQFNGTSQLYLPPGLTEDRSTAGIDAAVASTGATPGTIDPAAAALLQFKLPNGQYLIPTPVANAATLIANNQPDATLFSTPSFKADQINSSIDANLSSADVLSLKYMYQHDPAVNPYTDSNVDGFTESLDSGSQLASIINSYTPSSHLSTQQTFGFVREKAYSSNTQPLTPQQVGINLFGFSTFPGINISDSVPNGGHSLKIGPTGSFFRDGLFQNSFQPRSTVTQTIGRHTLTYGGSFNYTQLNIRNRRQDTGIIAFSNFANFVSGTVKTGSSSTFLQGASNRYYRSKDIGAFVQDDWQALPGLSLTLGIRYDYDGPLSEKYGNFFNFDPTLYNYDAASDTITNNGFIIAGNNKNYATPGVSSSTLLNRQDGIAPRIGFAWTPSANHGAVVFRGGFGLYYNRGEYFSYLSPGAGSGISGPFGVTQEPPFVVPTNAPKGATLSNPFGTTLPAAPNGNPSLFTTYLPTYQALIGGAQTFPFGSYDIHNKLPYTENWSLDMQWQPARTVAVDIGYVGNRGRHGVIPIPFNQPEIASPGNPVHGQTASYGYQVTDLNGNPLTTEPINTYDGGNVDVRTPYLGYSPNSVLYKANGNSAYDALQVQVQKRLSRGLQGSVSYTWSHSLDEQSGLGLFYNGSNPLDLRSGYGSSDFDRTHVVTFDYVYTLPTFVHGNSILAKAVNGFALEGITVLQSGQPYSIEDYTGSVGSQYYSNNDGITNPIIPLAPGVSPHQALTGRSGAFYQADHSDAALNPNAFSIPFLNPGQNNVPSCGVSTTGAPVCDVFESNFGPAGQRNIFRQSFQKRADVSLAKTFGITQRISAKYTFDVFNVTNTPSFDVPNNSLSTGYNLPNNTATSDLNYGQLQYDPSLSQVKNRQTAFNVADNGVNVSGTSDLGVVEQTIGSNRIISMSLHLLF